MLQQVYEDQVYMLRQLGESKEKKKASESEQIEGENESQNEKKRVCYFTREQDLKRVHECDRGMILLMY